MGKLFGKDSKGNEASLITLENNNGIKVVVSDFGATIVSIFVPNKDKVLKDVVLGYNNVLEYENGSCFFGCVVGRNANRIGKAGFELNGVNYQLTPNDNGNNLHSGNDYFHTRIWAIDVLDKNIVTFSLESPEGDQGYAGTVNLKVTYALTDEDELEILYEGKTDKDTVLNLTNHSYFNMNGHDSGDVKDQKVWIDADYITVCDRNLIPTGELLEVRKTPFDFREERKIGDRIDSDHDLIKIAGGYDHNWCLNNKEKFEKVASLYSEKSGIKMWVYSDLPGVQVYTGNFLGKQKGKCDIVYDNRSGVCFETQYYPDAINQKKFKSPVIKKDENYMTKTVYKFEVVK